MSLEVSKLEKVRELAGGIVQARCPACAEGGHDRAGEHLRIYPDGRFGCCVHPKDGEHRKRIWALAGVRQPAAISLRLKTPPALPSVQSVKKSLTGYQFGTLGTAEVKLCARARVDSTTTNIETANILEKLKDSDSAVLNVPPPVVAGERLPFLTAGGDLSIPFDSPERYHWWKNGQSVAESLLEVKERMKNAISI